MNEQTPQNEPLNAQNDPLNNQNAPQAGSQPPFGGQPYNGQPYTGQPYSQPFYGQQPYSQPPYGYGQPYNQPQQAQKKSVVPTDRRDMIFAGLSLLLALLGVIGGAWGHFQAGFSVFFICLFFTLSVYLGKGAKFPGVFATVCGVCSLGLSTVFFLTTATSVRFFSFLLLPCLSAVWFAGLAGRKVSSGDLGILSFLCSLFIGAIGKTPKFVQAVFSSRNKKSKQVFKVLLGICCALPVLLAVIPLLKRSDMAFSNLLEKLFANTGRLFFQFLLSAILSMFLIGYAFYLRKEPAKEKKPSSGFGGIDPVIITSALSALSVCYLVYLFSQLAYFFSGFLGILPEGYGFTHAEYARRGFFELCAIAGINLAVLFAALLLSRKKNNKPPVSVRIPATFIVLFNLFLIGTAISKLALYIRAYGMTVLRVGTSAFAVFIGVVFISLLLRFYLPKVRVLSVALPAAACVLMALGMGNINQIVANYNYKLYTSGEAKKVDMNYFCELGAEGTACLVLLAEDEDEKLAEQAKEALYYALQSQYDGEFKTLESGEFRGSQYFAYGEKSQGGLRQFSIPRWKMYQKTDAFLKANPDFFKEEVQTIYRNEGVFYSEYADEESTTFYNEY